VAEYLSTKEVAAYLRLNEKKIYAMVAAGQLPAARISGKWLFPRHAIDQWVDAHTLVPKPDLMGALLDHLLVVQGSDDPLFAEAARRVQERQGLPLVASTVGSLAALDALSHGQAHLAGCHVSAAELRRGVGAGQGRYVVTLFERSQGLLFDAARTPGLRGLADAAGRGLSLAIRQASTGTASLVRDLLDEAGVGTDAFVPVGPFASHLEVANAVRAGQADVGVGIRWAAERCGLAFVPLREEAFQLAFPLAYASHRSIAGFLEGTLDDLGRARARGITGYGFDGLGRVETASDPCAPGGAKG